MGYLYRKTCLNEDPRKRIAFISATIVAGPLVLARIPYATPVLAVWVGAKMVMLRRKHLSEKQNHESK